MPETPVRIHFQAPKEPYKHPETGAELEFWTGLRYFVKSAGKNGMYFPTDGKSIIDGWKYPKKHKLDVKPLPKFSDVRDAAVWYAIAGWVEEWFHVTEEKNKNTGNKYRKLVLCEGPSCQHCREKKEKRFGKKVYIPFSASQWDAMWIANEKAHSRCKCGGIIYTCYYICSGCEEPLYDFASQCYSCESEELTINEDKEEFVCNDCGVEWSIYPFNNAELYKDVTAKTKCRCGHVGVPQPVQYCTECEENYDSYGILDYQMKISAKSQGEGKAKIVTITDMVVQEPDPRLFDPKFQSDDPEWGEKIAKGNKTPIDLNRECAPFSNDKECELLKVGNPFEMSDGGGEEFRNYSRNQEEETEGEDYEGEEEVDEEPQRSRKGPSRAKGMKKKGSRPSFARRPGR